MCLESREGLLEFDDGLVGADDIVLGHEDALHDAILVRGKVILHFHGFVDEHVLTGFNLVAGFDEDLNHCATHGSLEHRTGDLLLGSLLFLGFNRLLGGSGCLGCLELGFTLVLEEACGHCRKKLQEEIFLIILGHLHATELGQLRIGGLAIGIDVIGSLDG